jgi:CheY-like chemotaxis protein
MRTKRPILLVEDDEVDLMSVQRALKDLNVTNRLVHARDGEEGLAVLNDPGLQKPAIILLDINMPRMNGIEFLRAIKKDPGLKQIPVVMLTTSRAEAERFETFSLGAAGYMIKPIEYRQFVEVMRAINIYWSLSELPE